MFNIADFKEWLKRKDRKKTIEVCVTVICVGLILVIFSSSFTEEKDIENTETESETSIDIAREMEKILSDMKGVGKVNVMITYSSSTEKITASDNKLTTRKSDGTSGQATIEEDNQTTTVYEEDSSGRKKAIVLKENMPEIEGVLVIAEGADNAVVKENIVSAVQALTGALTHKIQVFERK